MTRVSASAITKELRKAQRMEAALLADKLIVADDPAVAGRVTVAGYAAVVAAAREHLEASDYRVEAVHDRLFLVTGKP